MKRQRQPIFTDDLKTIYGRNLSMFYGVRKPKRPTALIGGKMEAVPEQPQLDTLWSSERQTTELLSLYLLDSLNMRYGEKQVPLREFLLRSNPKEQAASFKSISKETAGEIFYGLGLRFVQSKDIVGIQGDTFYGNWRAQKTLPEELTWDALRLCFGQDEWSNILDGIIGDTHCPNLIDVLLDTEFAETIEELRKHGPGYSSMHNYFACRGMDYISQTAVIKHGVVLGMAYKGYVVPTLSKYPNIEVRKAVVRNTKVTGGSDLVVLNSDPGVLLYFTGPDLEAFLQATGFRVRSQQLDEIKEGNDKPAMSFQTLVGAYRGVIYNFG